MPITRVKGGDMYRGAKRDHCVMLCGCSDIMRATPVPFSAAKETFLFKSSGRLLLK